MSKELVTLEEAEAEKKVDEILKGEPSKEKVSPTFERNETNKNSHGGTERMMEQIYRDLPADLLAKYQIIPSRVRELDETRHRVLYLHDLAHDPEAKAAVDLNGSWTRFNRLVFVSHWQRNQFMSVYPGIAWSRTAVIQNSIKPIDIKEKPKDKINLIYHTTPHRGLNILLAVFPQLKAKYPNLHLDVYSSFEIYGWGERDKTPEVKPLLDAAAGMDGVTSHGYKPNDEIRKALQQAHIFAYPSIWPETSCIALIEAMSAGCVCVHPDFAALPETSANWTYMYNWNEDIQSHARQFFSALDIAIQAAIENNKRDSFYTNQLMSQKNYVDMFNNWDIKKHQWEGFLTSFSNEPKEIQSQFQAFNYEA